MGGSVYINVNSTAFVTGNTITGNIAGYQYFLYEQGGGILIDSSKGELFDDVHLQRSGQRERPTSVTGAGSQRSRLRWRSTEAGINGDAISINGETTGGGLYAKDSASPSTPC